MKKKAMAHAVIYLIYSVVVVVLILLISNRTLWGASKSGLNIGPNMGNDFKLDEIQLELAKDLFNQYTQIISDCEPNKYGKKCVCGNLMTGALGDLAILAEEGRGDVIFYLLSVSLDNTDIFDADKKGLVKSKIVLKKDYGSMIYPDNNIFKTENVKYTMITNDKEGNTKILMSGGGKFENKINNNFLEYPDLYLLRNKNDPKIYNSYLFYNARRENVYQKWKSCEFYSNLERLFDKFNADLEKSFKRNSESIFDDVLPEGYSINVTEVGDGLNVSLWHYVPREDLTPFEHNGDFWELMDSVYYPDAKFYALEQAYQSYPDLTINVDYTSRLGNDYCSQDNQVCWLKEKVIKDSSNYIHAYKISQLTFIAKDGVYNVSKGYSEFKDGKWEEVKNSDFTKLNEIYGDPGDNNLGGKIVFAKDSSSDYLTINTFKVQERCHGDDSLCVDESVCNDFSGEIFSDGNCEDGKVCCYLPCKGNGETCEANCGDTSVDCDGSGCPTLLNGKQHFSKAMSGDEYSGYCPDDKICCKYKTEKASKIDENLENANEVFANYAETISNCKDSGLGTCVCGTIALNNLGDYSLLAVKWQDENGNNRVNLSLIPGRLQSMGDYVKEMDRKTENYNIDYGTLYNYALTKGHKFTQIYLDNGKLGISYGDDLKSDFKKENVNNPNDKLTLIFSDGKVYNLNHEIIAGKPASDVFQSCTSYKELKDSFDMFNNALSSSLKDSKEHTFQGNILEGYSFAVDKEKNGLNVSLLQYDEVYSHNGANWKEWRPIYSVSYPNADFYACEKSFYRNPLSHEDIHNYNALLKSDYCYDSGICLLKEITINDGTDSEDYRVSGLRFYYDNSENTFGVEKRYELASRKPSVISEGIKSSLDAIYTDSGDKNLGDSIIFVNDEAFTIGNNVTIATYNPNLYSCSGEGYSCVDPGDCKYKVSNKLNCKEAGEVCCFNECKFNGGVCVPKCDGGANCLLNCPKNTDYGELQSAMIDLNDEKVCPNEEVCCQYEK